MITASRGVSKLVSRRDEDRRTAPALYGRARDAVVEPLDSTRIVLNS